VLRDLLRWLADWPERAATDASAGAPLMPLGLTVSPIAGRDGNHEYLLWLAASAGAEDGALVGEAGEQMVERVVAEALSDVGPMTR
jgi:hypothetical protein